MGKKNGNHIGVLFSIYCLGFTAIYGVKGSLEVRCIMWDSAGYMEIDPEWLRTTSVCTL